jgi:hypothetical protein
MTDNDLQIILRMMPVNLYNRNIFEVFNQVVELFKKRQKFLKRNFSLFNIHVRRKFVVLFNIFRDRYNLELYGDVHRKYLVVRLLLIFDDYVNDKGQLVYFLKFRCEPATRKWWRFKYEPGTSERILIIHRNWHHTIEMHFAHNTEKENIKNTERFYDTYRYPPKGILEKQFQKYLTLPNDMMNII